LSGGHRQQLAGRVFPHFSGVWVRERGGAMSGRSLRGRVERLERDTVPEDGGIYFVLTEEDKREAEAREKAALARGEKIVRISIGGIDLVDGI